MVFVNECFGIPLIEAVKENDMHLVKMLLAKGAPVDVIDECGYTALHWAALYDRPECAHALLTLASQKEDIDIPDKDGYTALQLGIKHGHKDITQLLVTYGAEINGNQQNLPSPVELAQEKGFDDILSVLHSAQENQQNLNSKIPEKWKLGRLLGCGGFGKVFICYDLIGDREIAVKRIETNSKRIIESMEMHSLDSEIKILKNLSHNCIVRYFGMERRKTTMNIFMEYLPGGSMNDFVSKHGGLNEDKVRIYCRQILEGVAYLHANMIVHRDIKGANILLTHDHSQAKLADFGLSKRLQRCSTIVELKATLGSPYWMAPEVVRASSTKGEGYGRKADIWSVGCTVVEMLTSKPPWSNMEPMSAIYNIGTGKIPPEVPEGLSGGLRDFLSQTFKRDSKSRPQAKVLLNHPFITNESVSITKRANNHLRRSLDTINYHITETLEKANQVRLENNKIVMFLALLTIIITIFSIMITLSESENLKLKFQVK